MHTFFFKEQSTLLQQTQQNNCDILWNIYRSPLNQRLPNYSHLCILLNNKILRQQKVYTKSKQPANENMFTAIQKVVFKNVNMKIGLM